MRRYVLLLIPLLALLPVRAEALSVRDILELTKAGLGEEVLLALIDVDPSVFPIDAATLKSLKAAGVSERVIVAMVRSARTPPPPLDPFQAAVDPPSAPEPQIVVIDHHDAPTIREVQVAVPVFVPVIRHNGFQQRDTTPRIVDQRFLVAPPTILHPMQNPSPEGRGAKPAEPVYWGWGGTLRPDAWKPK